MRPSAASLSAALHLTAAALVLWLFRSGWIPPRPPPPHFPIYLPSVPLPAHRAGGGQRELLLVSRGNLPPGSPRPVMPLMIRPVNLNPRLSVAPAILEAPDIEIPHIATDRLGAGVAIPVARGGLTRLSGRVSAPVLLYKTEPEYSEDARKAKIQGVVVLAAEVGPDGYLTNIRIVRPLGLGLEEEAIRAVARWRFKPAMQNGRAVSSSVTIEVNLRVL